MKKGNSYSYDEIIKFAEYDYDVREIGPGIVGKSFIVLTHDYKDFVISFVLTGSSGNGFIYDCIYTD